MAERKIGDTGYEAVAERREALTAPGAKPLSLWGRCGVLPARRGSVRREAAEARGRLSPLFNTSRYKPNLVLDTVFASS